MYLTLMSQFQYIHVLLLFTDCLSRLLGLNTKQGILNCDIRFAVTRFLIMQSYINLSTVQEVNGMFLSQ